MTNDVDGWRRWNSPARSSTVASSTAGESTGVNKNPSVSAGSAANAACSELNWPRSGAGLVTMMAVAEMAGRMESSW
jgi:hypothetical protein